MKYAIYFILTLSFLGLFGQSNQSEYLEAKRQFSLGNYLSAQESFKLLMRDKDFGPYASFYFALSALKQGNKKEAYDVWLQTSNKFPQWDKQEEVRYWLAYTALELKFYQKAFRHLEKLPYRLKEALIKNVFSTYSLEESQDAYNQLPNKTTASFLVKKIVKQPYEDRDHFLIQELTDKYDLKIFNLDDDLEIVKKDKYSVAVVLPFMYESLNNPQTVIKNKIISNLYQGMLMAQLDLNKVGISLELFPYDTKKSRQNTVALTESGVLDNADAIIGPLYNGPNDVINQYSSQRKISMINPLSSNIDMIKNNSFAFLFKPSYETQGRYAAKYVSNKVNNKLAYILFESHRDSLLAAAYKNEIEKQGFLVLKYEQITNESAQAIQLEFTEKYEDILDDSYSDEQRDSINSIPGRIVKSRAKRSEEDGKFIKDDEGNDVIEFYEERLVIPEDSIGHMMVASSSNLMVNNFISLAEVRTDTIEIIGYQNWLDFSILSYNQLERLGITFISPNNFNKKLPWYSDFKQEMIDAFHQEPDEYHLLGYELVYQIGMLMKEYGKYFQIGLRSGKEYKGKFMRGIQYGAFNDNQIVPMTQLEDLQLVDQTNFED